MNCGGAESDVRLIKGLPCERCLPVHVADIARVIPSIPVTVLSQLMVKVGSKPKLIREVVRVERELEELNKLFEKALGSTLWSAQRTWARRVLKGRSFAIIAPTGVGKTVFGIIMSLYLASKGRKAYMVLPTTPLVTQVAKKAKEYAERAGLTSLRIIEYHSKLSRAERAERLKAIKNGEFDLLITTSRFISSRFDDLKASRFDFVFVDDVDSILKSSKNIDRILVLMGFPEEVVQKAYELIRVKVRLAALARTKGVEELKEELKLLNKLRSVVEKAAKANKSILVVSSATGRPRGLRVRLFRELLGFEIGSRSEFIRNIIDSYYVPEEPIEEAVTSIVRKLGGGGLVFVPVDKGVVYAKHIVEVLRESGVPAELFTSKNLKALQAFISGEVKVLVGVATYYGVLVRGLDLPEVVRYAVFAGVPRFKFSTRLDEPHPLSIVRALALVRSVVDEAKKRDIERLEAKLRRLLKTLSQASLVRLAERLKAGTPPESAVERYFQRALEIVREKLSDPDVRRRLAELPDIVVREEDGTTFIYIPDVMTYIQASGRTSRMYAGGITLGLSVVVVDEPRLFQGLQRRMRWVVETVSWVPFSEMNVNEVIKRIDADRERVKAIVRGGALAEAKELVKTVLLVVESPNKARTISRFFGKPSIRRFNGLKVYEVSIGDMILMITASGGHVYDLVTDEGFHGVKIVDAGGRRFFIPVYTAIRRCLRCGHQFSDDFDVCPKCKSKEVRSSLNTIKFLQDLALEVDMVMIGTDPDTEGEKIGWDLALLLAPYNKNILRIEFHEVTRRAILRALRSPREFKRNLIEAQIVRRVEDRWIGFELSQRLWRAFGKHWLSAGRVQTPVLGWVIERYKKWKESLQTVYRFKLPFDIEVEVPESDLPKHLVDKLKRGEKVKVVIMVEGEEEAEISPPPPYTTDSLLYDASALLRISAQEAMQIAQDLFELGFITYHRTDSTRVSGAGQVVARDYLKDKYPDVWESLYAPRSWGIGGAHECIRPTRPIDVRRLREMIVEGIITPVKRLTKAHFKLYDLIFRRFIASQMAKARVRRQRVSIDIDGFRAGVERVVAVLDKGFLEVLPVVKAAPRVKPGIYDVLDLEVTTRRTVQLYTQGDLVRLMRERGIGRPSTYAKIVQTLLQRGYVVETKRAKKLIPTDLGRRVYEYLVRNYGSLVSEERTALLERIMDKVESGAADYQEVLQSLYDEIRPLP